ncbi:hypothetical protein QF035_004832 [Streptomyces umbrinus]|uniref:DNA primase/polymerase bifunctional N-terminal domain-containing protein n=1 Tax=Streptomyces umbrinus TaxID=67370 RepID=A0ABU0SUN4_9ACTN|nr:hypothetical protein [Streptomyces umbrinus]MDQ1027250.1 hypothetical protein [Streptomyces umbrinus]
MNPKTPPAVLHAWIPASGHGLRHAGIHFDAVRIADVLAEQVAYELMQFTDFQAGPIIREATGHRYMYFLLPPQSVTGYRWPSGARALGRGARGWAYVGVPALGGLTWPLEWRSEPTAEVPFVDAGLLHEVVSRLAGAVR